MTPKHHRPSRPNLRWLAIDGGGDEEHRVSKGGSGWWVEDAAVCQLSAWVLVVAAMWCAGQLEKKNGKMRGLLMVSVF
jgi:hypothetical protein